MADVEWPTTLPQGPSSFSQARTPNSVIRTNPDDGPAKMRRRFTKSVIQGGMNFTLTLAQWNILEEFYEIDLNHGTSFFLFYHPWYGEVRKFRFMKPPQASAEGSLAVNVTTEWELF